MRQAPDFRGHSDPFPEEIEAQEGSQGAVSVRGQQQWPDYQQYPIGNALYASLLRKMFDLTGGAGFALASEIVPVVALSPGEESGAGAQFGATSVPQVGAASIIGIRNDEPDPITIKRIMVNANIQRVAMLTMETSLSYQAVPGDGEVFGNRARDPSRPYAVVGIVGSVLAAGMPAGWDNVRGPNQISFATSSRITHQIDGPWMLNPGQRLVCFPTIINNEIGALFHFV